MSPRPAAEVKAANLGRATRKAAKKAAFQRIMALLHHAPEDPLYMALAQGGYDTDPLMLNIMSNSDIDELSYLSDGTIYPVPIESRRMLHVWITLADRKMRQDGSLSCDEMMYITDEDLIAFKDNIYDRILAHKYSPRNRQPVPCQSTPQQDSSSVLDPDYGELDDDTSLRGEDLVISQSPLDFAQRTDISVDSDCPDDGELSYAGSLRGEDVAPPQLPVDDVPSYVEEPLTTTFCDLPWDEVIRRVAAMRSSSDDLAAASNHY